MSECTFHSERGRACCLSVVVPGLTAVHSGVLGEDLEQQQRVLIFIMEELALVAGRQNLGVFVPGHLRLREAAHLCREANRPARHRRLRLHVMDNLRRFWH